MMESARSVTPSAALELDPARLIRAAGDRALLVTPPSHAATFELVTALRNQPLGGVQDVLPAAETILVTLLSPQDAQAVRRRLTELLEVIVGRGPASDSRVVSRGTLADNEIPVVVPVRYDGADIDEVARLLHLTRDEVIAAHTETVWHCAFVGFAPGFGYLDSPDGRLTVPRRSQSRTTIPAGAVALAGGYSAVYPRSTPGGWQLIGTTDLKMWEVDRSPPAIIRAGAAVRFIEDRG